MEEKHKNFKATERKRGNASCNQGENERQQKKKVNRNTFNISSKLKNVYLGSCEDAKMCACVRMVRTWFSELLKS